MRYGIVWDIITGVDVKSAYDFLRDGTNYVDAETNESKLFEG